MRRLTLRRETLAELGAEELALVAGAAARPTSPITGCVNDVTDDVVALTSLLVQCDSLFNPCVTSTCGGE